MLSRVKMNIRLIRYHDYCPIPRTYHFDVHCIRYLLKQGDIFKSSSTSVWPFVKLFFYYNMMILVFRYL